jgi:hypothetical protein
MNWDAMGRHHWLYANGKIRGQVYEVNPEAFSVYRETRSGPYTREFLCTLPTLDEAKDFLQTIVGAQL